jgi:hypothetical protein
VDVIGHSSIGNSARLQLEASSGVVGSTSVPGS